MSFPSYIQLDAMDCGPTCLRMIAKYYGKTYSLDTLRERCYFTRQGVSMLGIAEAAESIGFRTMGVVADTQMLMEENPVPCILHWKQNHFVVLYKAPPAPQRGEFPAAAGGLPHRRPDRRAFHPHASRI